jgi:hypothetical protein
MPWRDDFMQPLGQGTIDDERMRVRINTERGVVMDFVVQYETPRSDLSGEHVSWCAMMEVMGGRIVTCSMHEDTRSGRCTCQHISASVRRLTMRSRT